MPIQPVLTGQLLGGTYLLQREIGQGGLAVVYEALQVRLQRQVAVKVLRSCVAPEMLDRFWREARTMSRLGHPHIVDVSTRTCPTRACLTSQWSC